MCLVSFSEIAQVFFMGNVCFGQYDCSWIDKFGYFPEQLDDFMSFRPMKAGCSRLFPQEGNGIEPDNPGSAGKIVKQNIHHFDKYLWIGKVQINLVSTEGGPDMFLSP